MSKENLLNIKTNFVEKQNKKFKTIQLTKEEYEKKKGGFIKVYNCIFIQIEGEEVPRLIKMSFLERIILSLIYSFVEKNKDFVYTNRQIINRPLPQTNRNYAIKYISSVISKLVFNGLIDVEDLQKDANRPLSGRKITTKLKLITDTKNKTEKGLILYTNEFKEEQKEEVINKEQNDYYNVDSLAKKETKKEDNEVKEYKDIYFDEKYTKRLDIKSYVDSDHYFNASVEKIIKYCNDNQVGKDFFKYCLDEENDNLTKKMKNGFNIFYFAGKRENLDNNDVSSVLTNKLSVYKEKQEQQSKQEQPLNKILTEHKEYLKQNKIDGFLINDTTIQEERTKDLLLITINRPSLNFYRESLEKQEDFIISLDNKIKLYYNHILTVKEVSQYKTIQYKIVCENNQDQYFVKKFDFILSDVEKLKNSIKFELIKIKKCSFYYNFNEVEEEFIRKFIIFLIAEYKEKQYKELIAKIKDFCEKFEEHLKQFN